MNGQFSKFDRPYHLDPASTQAMQGEIKLLKTQLDYLENGNRRLHYSYEARNQDLQDKLDTCQNQNENLRNRIRQLENENIRIQSESSQNQREMANKVRGLTNENQSLRSSLDQRKPIMDCEGPIVEPLVPTISPVQPAPIIYIVAIVNDDGIGVLYTHVESFYNKMIASTANMEVQPEFRLVHRAAGEGLTRNQLRNLQNLQSEKTYTCETYTLPGMKKNGYIVTDIADCIAKHGSFDECFHRKVPDSANVICVGNAYHAMYENLAQESGRVALQFSVHPFSNQNERRFAAEDVYKFSNGAMSYKQLLVECNKDTTFADSALIITDAEFNYRDQWKDSFSDTNRKAWSELNRCALKDAQEADEKYGGKPKECANYLLPGQPENALTDVAKRNECPMIPNFGKSRISTNLPVRIAEQFFTTLE